MRDSRPLLVTADTASLPMPSDARRDSPASSAASALAMRPWRQRALDVSPVLYVAILAVWTDHGQEPRAWLGALVGTGLALVAARRPHGAARAVGWGLAVVVASLGAQRESPALFACAGVGVFAAASGACFAVARMPCEGGLVGQRPSPSPVRVAAALAFVWWGAIAARIAPHLAAFAWASAHPRAAGWGAILATAAILGGWTEWSLRRRHLELSVAERTTAMRGLLATLLVAAVLVALIGRAGAEGVACLALAGGGALLAWAALHPQAVAVGRAARRTVVLTIVGGTVALVGASTAAGSYSGDAWLATLVTAAIAIAIGSAAAALERPLLPAGGAWLEAMARAADEAVRAEPTEAIQQTLLALREPAGAGAASPELWTFAPVVVTTIDAAGYLHADSAEVPDALVLLAGAEPEATLRAEVLDAFEVRRPDVRPLVQWMSERAASLATVIACDGETEGVLVLPRYRRSEPFTLEEVRAFKRVADRLAGACRARGTQTRMLDRARDATARAERAEEREAGLAHARLLDAHRDALATTRLARPATVGVYSATSRGLLESLERWTATGAPIAVVAPSGADPVPYLAQAHLAGARGRAPMVIVDATSAREHDARRWTEPSTSPLALADKGLLVLLDGAVLPAGIQQLVARALAEKRGPWERADPLDVQLAITGVQTPTDLVEQGRLDPALASRLGEAVAAPLALPRLQDRPEDLRAILTDRLAREGLRVHGRPIGIEHAAYARLVDYPFPGEDAELVAIAQRLAAGCVGDVVRAPDVDALRLPAPEQSASESEVAPRFRTNHR